MTLCSFKLVTPTKQQSSEMHRPTFVLRLDEGPTNFILLALHQLHSYIVSNGEYLAGTLSESVSGPLYRTDARRRYLM